MVKKKKKLWLQNIKVNFHINDKNIKEKNELTPPVTQ